MVMGAGKLPTCVINVMKDERMWVVISNAIQSYL